MDGVIVCVDDIQEEEGDLEVPLVYFSLYHTVMHFGAGKSYRHQKWKVK